LTEPHEGGHSPLLLPSLRGRMGDWTYYLTLMKLRDVSERVSLAGEIHKTKTLRELIQRQLVDSRHSSRIADYLLQQPQRLFSSLTIGVYGGDPHWYELDVRPGVLPETEEEVPRDVQFTLGLLQLDGTERLFAMDGQHRVVGIQKALAQRPELGEEEVGALFVGHQNVPAGMERSRRLFTTLNRYAKPVSMFEKIALDEDDLVALVTRRLLEEHPLFMEKLSLARSASLPPTDTKNFTSLVTLYNSLDVFLRTKVRGWPDFKRYRPDEDVIENAYESAEELWALMAEHFSPVREMRDAWPEDNIPAKYRGPGGGHLLFRPVGLFSAIRAIRAFRDSGVSLPEAVIRIATVPMDLASYPWVGLLWNAIAGVMVVTGETQRAAPRLLLHSAGGDLRRLSSSPEALREEIAGLTNAPLSEVVLRQYFTGH
jgi:DNA sulfur modification protein DndB